MMSLIHWNKSVLSFHLREIIEDGNGSHPLAVAGLSVIAANTLLLPAVMKLGKPVLKAAIKKTLPSSPTASVISTDASDVRQIWQQAAIATQNSGSSSDRASKAL
ncbi:hypothetical protein [Halothece sp. PCC 7418]|uniref:hypothetical protein n=1 Tax=Halothece sp. (strain PCC 7418) TaxID=65093 RepID=UPI0002F15158|nr:hypothetical protein [Halothece sp. PCC 7418]